MLFDEIATAASSPTAGTAGGTGLTNMDSFMAIFMIVIGVFTLYSAITGKGPAYKNDYPKAMQADANKMMRIFCWIIGPIVTVFGVLDYMNLPWAGDWLNWVSIGVTLTIVIAYFILFRRRFKQYLK